MTGILDPDGRVFFQGDDRLEGLLEWPQDGTVSGGVVVAHPHPLYGGTMAQPVVYRVAKACRERGFASLRFNFRGVGKSRGTHSGLDESRDVEAAAAYLRGRLAGVQGAPAFNTREKPLALGGYSFGSVMAAIAAGGQVPVQALVLVAFVVAWRELPPRALERLSVFRGPVLAVCGERDDLAPPGAVEDVLRNLNLDFRLSVVEGADHFFEGRQKDVGEKVAVFLEHTGVGARVPARIRVGSPLRTAVGTSILDRRISVI